MTIKRERLLDCLAEEEEKKEESYCKSLSKFSNHSPGADSC